MVELQLDNSTAKTIIAKGREGWEGKTYISNNEKNWGVRISTWKNHRGLHSSYQFHDITESGSTMHQIFSEELRYKRGDITSDHASRCTENSITALHTKAVTMFPEICKGLGIELLQLQEVN